MISSSFGDGAPEALILRDQGVHCTESNGTYVDPLVCHCARKTRSASKLEVGLQQVEVCNLDRIDIDGF